MSEGLKPFPQHKNGLVVPVYELGYTQPTEAQIAIRGLVNVHHNYWPHSVFSQHPITRMFKNAYANTSEMLGYEHNVGQETLHTKYKRPKIPPLDTMIDFLDEQVALYGFIDSVKQNKTREHYQVTTDQWELVRGAHGLQVYGARNSLSNLVA